MASTKKKLDDSTGIKKNESKITTAQELKYQKSILKNNSFFKKRKSNGVIH